MSDVPKLLSRSRLHLAAHAKEASKLAVAKEQHEAALIARVLSEKDAEHQKVLMAERHKHAQEKAALVDTIKALEAKLSVIAEETPLAHQA